MNASPDVSSLVRTTSATDVLNSEEESDLWERIASHRERLRRLAAARLGHHASADVEDCVHEALIRAATFPSLDETRLAAFLTTVTLRLCVDVQRGMVRQQHFLPKYHYPDHENAEEEICDRAMASWLLERVEELAARERQVILARASGMSAATAAKNLNISPKSAESAYTRARKHLRGMYDAEMLRR